MSEMNAQVILRLVDELTGPARKIQSTIRGIIKDVEKLNRMAGKSSGARQFDGLTKGIRQANTAAQQLRQTMARPLAPNFARGATSNVNHLTSAANRATAAVGRMSQAMRRMPSGSGGTGRMPSTVRPSRRHSGGGMHIPGAGFVHSIKHAAMFQLTEGLLHGVKETFRTSFGQAFEQQHTQAMLALQGESKEGIAAAVSQARKMSSQLPQFTTAQHLEAIAELRPALLGGLEEATKLAPMFQHSISVLEAVKQGAGKKALGGIDTHGEALSLVRAMEVKNVTGLGEKTMQSYVDGITKAIVAFNGQIKAEDFHSAFKFSRGDAVNWSQDFATTILPTIMNELKKSSKTDASMTGNALKSMSRVVMDGVMGPDVLARWEHLGMLSPGAFKKGKNGKLGKNGDFMGAAMLGGSVWQSNPYQWVQDYLLPHMKSHGVDLGNRKQVVAALGGLFGNRVANHIAQILATQQAIIEKDKENVKKAQGTGGLKFLMGADPTTRMQVLSASIKDMLGALGDVGFAGAMRGMKGVTDWSHHIRNKVANSAYAKRIGNYFDSSVAGFFGQGIGRRMMSGRDRDYYGAGRLMGGGLGALGSALGGLAARAEQAGVAIWAMRAIGGAAHAAAYAIRHMNGYVLAGAAAFAGFKVLKGVKSALFEGFGLKGAAVALNEAALALKASAFPGRGVPGSVVGAPGGKNGSIPTFGWRTLFAGLNLGSLAWGADDHLGIDPKTGRHFIKPNADVQRLNEWWDASMPWWLRSDASDKMPWNAARAAIPSFAPIRPGWGVTKLPPMIAGNSEAAKRFLAPNLPTFAAAGGPALSTEAVTAQMTKLLGSLTSIASAGVQIPVMINTGDAEAKLDALMAKARSIGGAAGRPQYSKALNDTGG